MSQPLIFEYPLIVRESHLDTFGHVNNAKYLEIFEEARWEAITGHGYGMSDIQKSKQGPVILELNLKFLKELRLRKKVVIYTQVLKYEEKIGTMKQWIENDKKEICAEMTMIFGLFDLAERRLILPTPAWLKSIGLAPRT